MVLSVEAIALILGPVLVWMPGFEIDLLEWVSRDVSELGK